MRNLAQFIASVPPATFAAEYAVAGGYRMENGDPYFTFRYNNMRVEFRMFGNGFIISEYEFPLSMVDIVANQYGLSAAENYLIAVKELSTQFAPLIPEHLRSTESMKDIARYAYATNTALQLILRQSIPIRHSVGAETLDLGVWLDAPIGVACLLNKDEWEFVERILNSNAKKKLKNTDRVLVVPLFSNTCTLAGVLARQTKSSAWETYWTDAADTVAYTWLPAFRNNMQLFIHPSHEQALEAMLESNEPASLHTAAIPAPESTGTPWYPTSCHIVSSGHPMELLQYKGLAETRAWIQVTRAKHASQMELLGSASWNGAVADAVIDSVISDSPVVPTDTLLPLMRTNRDIQRRVSQALTAAGKEEEAYKLEHTFKTGLIWSSNDQELYETPSGYVYEDARTKALGGVQVTNFTIHPFRAARFEAGELFYGCEIRVRDEKRELDLPSHVFETARKLAEYIQTCLSLSGQSTEVEPTVFEPSYARPIMGHLHQKFASLAPVRGISFLGWDPFKAKFNGPDFLATTNVVSSIPVFKPTVAHLDVFTLSTDHIKQKAYKELSEPFRRVMAACAGIIARAYTNSELTPILYKDTPSTRSTLKNLFSLAGQGKIVHLNPNFRKGMELQVFQGYPVLATGYNCNQACASKAGIILLGESGEEIEDDGGVMEAAVALRYVIEELPAWIIREEGLPCVFSSVDVTSNQIVADGAKVLEAFFS